eukprot:8749066-Pyramimonas_sp.AAC.1
MCLGEARYHTDTGAEGPVGSRLVAAFNQSLGALCEVTQERDTHRIVRQTEEGDSGRSDPQTSLGRLDRIHTAL